MNFLIAGDLYISDEFKNKNLIDKSVQDLFSKADYRIVNLEAPITDDRSENKIIKTGPHLRMSEETAISVLNQLNIDGVTLANNHILDYGTKGLLDTFDTLKSKEVAYVGSGTNLKDAARYITLNKEGMKIAIINFCENEWSIAEENSPGANPMDIIDNANQIKEAKATHDKVIVIVHGGHEYYNLPSPRMQKQYRFYADQGADIVVGHHTHCISGNEVYNGVPIYYSLGNFLFTKNNPNDEWYTGLILEVDISSEGIDCQIHPVRQERGSFNLTLLEGEEIEEVFEKITNYNSIITNEKMLDLKWDEFINRQSHMYLNYWSPFSYVKNKYLNVVSRKLFGNMLNKKGTSLFLNLVRCEAHRDLSKEVLKKHLKE
ncbi:MAG: CapA family protein [Tissierellia bacterium]|nr:CapA family protein [Tissierellia bacterium]